MAWQTTKIRHTDAIEPDYPVNMRYVHLIAVEWVAGEARGRECVTGFGANCFEAEQDASRQKADWQRRMDMCYSG